MWNSVAIGCTAFMIAAVTSAGCSVPKASDLKPSKLFSMDSTWPWRDKDAPREGTPVRMAGTWTDTVLHKTGEKPQRGFGGRIVFFDRDEKQPILVDGQLVVYAFEETERDPTDNKPTRRYVFPADQLPLHMSNSELGASYSFWLPWDDAGGPKTEVSLICRFEPKKGAVITSEQTRHLLPGQELPIAAAARQPLKLPEGVPARPAPLTLEALQNARRIDPNMRPANYETAVGSSEPGHTGVLENHVQTTTLVPERRMTVSSIALPKNYHIPAAPPGGAPAQHAARLPQSTSPTQGQPQLQQMTPGPHTAATTPNLSTAPAGPTSNAAPAAQPFGTALGTHQWASPQLITPRLMNVQPAQSATPAAPATIIAPAARPQ